MSALWTIGPESRDLLTVLHVGGPTPVIAGALAVGASLWFARAQAITLRQGIAATLVGVSVALAWVATFAVSEVSIEIVPVASITFTGPSADTLMAFVGTRAMPMSFGLGLVPGVVLGSALAAALSREWAIQRFTAETPIERYIAGAVLMGFGAMLAGGCAVGSAVAGGSVFATTAWVAGVSIWVGGILSTWATEGRLFGGRHSAA